MLHGSLRHEEKRENIRPKRSLELARSNFLDGILEMLLRCVIDQNVDSAQPLLSLRDCLPAKFLVADITINQQAFATLLFYESLGLFRIFVLLQVDDCYICAFLGKRDRNRTTNSAVSTCDDGDF